MKSIEHLRMWLKSDCLIIANPQVRNVSECLCVVVLCGFFCTVKAWTPVSDQVQRPPTVPQHTPLHLHTGWPDYRARQNHLQQGLNYTQTPASCWPLLGQDCLAQVSALSHTFDTRAAGWHEATCCTCRVKRVTCMKSSKICCQDSWWYIKLGQRALLSALNTSDVYHLYHHVALNPNWIDWF